MCGAAARSQPVVPARQVPSCSPTSSCWCSAASPSSSWSSPSGSSPARAALASGGSAPCSKVRGCPSPQRHGAHAHAPGVSLAQTSGTLCSPAQARAACTALHALHTHCLCTHTLLTHPRQDVLPPWHTSHASPHAPHVPRTLPSCSTTYTPAPASSACITHASLHCHTCPHRGYSGHHGAFILGVFPRPWVPSVTGCLQLQIPMAMQGEPPAPWSSRLTRSPASHAPPVP